MYRKQYGQRNSSGRRFSAGNRSRSNKKGGNNAQFSDVTKFVNKAVALEEKPYEAKHSFSDFIIEEVLKNNISRASYKAPSPIQDECIPHVLEGRDLVGIANTGTGKTAAFLIPLIDKVLKDKSQNILIMAPTRELAIQINQEFVKFAGGLKIFSVCAVGGAPIFRQVKDLKRSHNFVIGTPGRLKDLSQRKSLRLERFQTVVLDEADRMLDMGFITDMRFILSSLSKERQTLFFSATLSNDIKGIINEFLKNPINISVKTRDTSSSIDQDVVYVKGFDKIEKLHDLLIQPNFDKVLIFGRTKHGVERLSKTLYERGFKTNSIHGDKSHGQRQRALQSFKGNQVNILVATDVAARGLDISGVSHVINYELPSTYEDYIHRIGRTGRGGKSGKALTFVEK